MGAANGSQGTELYVAAQRWLNGFVNNTINQPLPDSVLNGSDAAAGRTKGVEWTAPEHKPPAGRDNGYCHG